MAARPTPTRGLIVLSPVPGILALIFGGWAYCAGARGAGVIFVLPGSLRSAVLHALPSRGKCFRSNLSRARQLKIIAGIFLNRLSLSLSPSALHKE
jgi:hypothetical protein